jgi:hypothetical protein
MRVNSRLMFLVYGVVPGPEPLGRVCVNRTLIRPASYLVSDKWESRPTYFTSMIGPPVLSRVRHNIYLPRVSHV